jgi:hypothetical protein
MGMIVRAVKQVCEALLLADHTEEAAHFIPLTEK